MRSKTHAIATSLAAGFLLIGAGAARAQGGNPAVRIPTAAPPLDTPANTPLYTAGAVLARIGRAAGVTVVAGSSVAGQRVLMPAAPTTPANVEQQIADVARQLPAGTQWAKLTLPAPPAGRTWNGDDVIQFATAAARLYGPGVVSLHAVGARTVSAAAEDGPTLLAQSIPPDRAAQYAADLHLQPIYVVANPTAGKSRGETLPPRQVINPAQDPEALQKFLATLPPGPKADDLRARIAQDPNSVRITTDADGHTFVEVHREEYGPGK